MRPLRPHQRRRAGRQGYAILLALLMISLVGAAVFVLARVSNDFLFEADQAYGNACRRNLAASALAWARQHPDELRKAGPARAISLEADSLKVHDGRLRLTPLAPAGKLARVRLHIRFRCGRSDQKHTDDYLIAPDRK